MYTILCTRLARNARRDVLTVIARLAASDVDALPGPVRAAAITAKDEDRVCIVLNGTGDTVKGNAGDLNVVAGGAGGATVLVVLLDDDTVVGDTRELDVRVGDVADGAGLIDLGLDAQAVGRVADSRVGDGDVLDGVVIAAANGADGETVATRAGTARELDVLARVDGDTIVLVLDGGAADVDTVRLADVERVGVVAAVVVAVRVVDGQVLENSVVGLDTDGLHGSVLDVQAGDSRVLDGVDIHELGLGLAAVRALAVPPARALAINHGILGSGDGEAGTTEADERALPLLVAEGGGTLEGNLGVVGGVREVQGLTGGDLNVLKHDIRALRNALRGRRGVGEGAGACALGEVRSTRGCRGSRDNGAQHS